MFGESAYGMYQIGAVLVLIISNLLTLLTTLILFAPGPHFFNDFNAHGAWRQSW